MRVGVSSLARFCAGALVLAASAASAAEWRGQGFVLTYSETVWRKLGAAPPVLASLTCVAPTCPAGTTLALVADSRPLPRPAASPRAPGAVSSALLAVRAAALVPGRRLIAESPATPVRAGACPALQARFTVEHPDLTRSALLDVMLPRPQGAWHIVLAGPSLPPQAVEAFGSVVAGLRIQGCS